MASPRSPVGGHEGSQLTSVGFEHGLSVVIQHGNQNWLPVKSKLPSPINSSPSSFRFQTVAGITMRRLKRFSVAVVAFEPLVMLGRTDACCLRRLWSNSSHGVGRQKHDSFLGVRFRSVIAHPR